MINGIHIGTVGVMAGYSTVDPVEGCGHSLMQSLKVLDEAGELNEAYKKWHASGYQYHIEDVLDEAADVIQAVSNLIASIENKLSLTDNPNACEDFSYRMDLCRSRNERRGRQYVE